MYYVAYTTQYTAYITFSIYSIYCILYRMNYILYKYIQYDI